MRANEAGLDFARQMRLQREGGVDSLRSLNIFIFHVYLNLQALWDILIMEAYFSLRQQQNKHTAPELLHLNFEFGLLIYIHISLFSVIRNGSLP